MTRILYIHGMGGGSDSRIPGILRESLPDCQIVCRTYGFDPDEAHLRISQWFDEVHPDLIIGESLGSLHAMRIRGVPHLFVSPAPQGGWLMGSFSPFARMKLVRLFFNWKFRPRKGDRQTLDFSYDILKKYRSHSKEALRTARDSEDCYFAFFGTRDHYRKWGIVNIRKWKQLFGKNSCSLYTGTHYMEEEFIHSMLIPKILELTT